MSDVLITITKLINSPPGQLAAGGVLAGIVWKFFERVEAVLNEDTKLEIAVWLLGRKVAPTVDRRSVYLRLFWAVCGTSSSRKRLIVASILTVANTVLSGLSIANRYVSPLKLGVEWTYFALSLVCSMIVLDLNERFLARTFGLRPLMMSTLTIALSATLGVIAIVLWTGMSPSSALSSPRLGEMLVRLSMIPAITVSIWMWLPSVSGVILKFARRFDIGFEWFNRKFDIEKHPLQSIGLVAGALVAVVYWAAVIVSRVVG